MSSDVFPLGNTRTKQLPNRAMNTPHTPDVGSYIVQSSLSSDRLSRYSAKDGKHGTMRIRDISATSTVGVDDGTKTSRQAIYLLDAAITNATSPRHL